MSKPEICRIAAGGLIALIGVAVGFGSVQLWNGAPKSWPDITASDATVQSTARGMIVMAVLLLGTGLAAALHLSWGRWAAAIAIGLFVAGAFWANSVLFGNLRPMHTVPNVLVASVILYLLWVSEGHLEFNTNDGKRPTKSCIPVDVDSTSLVLVPKFRLGTPVLFETLFRSWLARRRPRN